MTESLRSFFTELDGDTVIDLTTPVDSNGIYYWSPLTVTIAAIE
jgi:hypothetical protein